jgi:hypothetical protein
MTVKPDLSKYRNSYSGGVRALNESRWGQATAERRYGPLQYRDGAPAPKDQSGPQRLGDPNNLQGPKYHNNTSGWVRAEGEDATTKPNLDSVGRKGYHGRRS